MKTAEETNYLYSYPLLCRLMRRGGIFKNNIVPATAQPIQRQFWLSWVFVFYKGWGNAVPCKENCFPVQVRRLLWYYCMYCSKMTVNVVKHPSAYQDMSRRVLFDVTRLYSIPRSTRTTDLPTIKQRDLGRRIWFFPIRQQLYYKCTVLGSNILQQYSVPVHVLDCWNALQYMRRSKTGVCYRTLSGVQKQNIPLSASRKYLINSFLRCGLASSCVRVNRSPLGYLNQRYACRMFKYWLLTIIVLTDKYMARWFSVYTKRWSPQL